MFIFFKKKKRNGAIVSLELNSSCTHILSQFIQEFPLRIFKHIKIVNCFWLYDCLSQSQFLNENSNILYYPTPSSFISDLRDKVLFKIFILISKN